MHRFGLIKKIIHFFIFTHLFLAACVTSLVVETYIILFGSVIDLRYPFFLFCSTLVLYSFHRVYRFNLDAADEELAERHKWIKRNKFLYFSISIAALCGVIYSVLFLVSIKIIVYLLPIGLICFAYTVPCIPSLRGWLRLRDIGGIKIILICLVLGLTTVLLPIIAYGKFSEALHPAVIFIFIRRMLFIFAITIPFDIRDVEFDRSIGTRTIPVMFGIANAKSMALSALLLFVVSAAVQYFFYQPAPFPYAFSISVSVLISAFMIIQTNEKRGDIFYSFGMEGMMLLQCLGVMIVHKFV